MTDIIQRMLIKIYLEIHLKMAFTFFLLLACIRGSGIYE